MRQLVDKNRKKVIFQQNTEQKIYERIKTDQVVYKNRYRKMTNENEDLIESYNQLAMENKKVFDSLKRQNMRKGGPLKKEGVSKNG